MKQKLYIIYGFDVRAQYVTGDFFLPGKNWEIEISMPFYYYEEISTELLDTVFQGWFYP